MTIARSQQVSLEHTPYYHCTSRCVRRAFLCGEDHYSGKNFEHRRQWLEERLMFLSDVFAIDLLAYAIMSNHYHVVIRLNPLVAASWPDEEVLNRWNSIYAGPVAGVMDSQIETFRERLSSLSWFMRAINEPIARRANREDGCKGRFWEGRFKSQAILDEIALLKCMAYVDLNPIRADIARTPEDSEYTSAKARIDGNDRHLVPFESAPDHSEASIPFSLKEYLSLVDWTGRMIRSDKCGAIRVIEPPILARLNLKSGNWVDEMQHYGNWYYRAVGSLKALRRYCDHLGQQWLKGASHIQANNV